jgi:hypothetical protein
MRDFKSFVRNGTGDVFARLHRIGVEVLTRAVGYGIFMRRKHSEQKMSNNGEVADPSVDGEPNAQSATEHEGPSVPSVDSQSEASAHGPPTIPSEDQPAPPLVEPLPTARSSDSEDPPDVAPPRQKPRKSRSPAEAFEELTETVSATRLEVRDLKLFAEAARKELHVEVARSARKPVLQSLFKLHDWMFNQLTAKPPPAPETKKLAKKVLQVIEAELRGHRVNVLKPDVGEQVDHDCMKSFEGKQTKEASQVGTISRLRRCGFIADSEGERQPLRRAFVEVYTRQPTAPTQED